MADQRLRELERRWLDGDVDAGARWLAERVRAGELAAWRLELAACWSDAAARAALAWDRPERRLDGLLVELAARGHEPAVHAALAVSRLALADLEARRPLAAVRGRAAIAAAEAWLAAPGAEAARQAEQAARDVEGGTTLADVVRDMGPVFAIGAAARAAAAPDAAAAAHHVLAAVHLALARDVDLETHDGEPLLRAEPFADEAALRAAIGKAVAAWALGR